MKRALLFVLLGFVAGAGSLVLVTRWPGLLPALQQPASTPASVAAGAVDTAASTTRRIKYWRAPMDPTYIRNEPGKSPMGMDLIPVYEDETDLAPGVVTIDPRFVQTFGVQSVPVARADIPRVIRTVGVVRYDDEQTALVTTKYEGWIERAYVNYVGQPVAAGAPLFEVYSPALVSTQEEYLHALEYAKRMAESGMDDMSARADSMLDAARRRLAYWDVSPAQIADLEQTGAPRRTLPVLAARAGVVVWKMDTALEGMYVQAGMNLYRIADLSSVWVDADLFEDQMASVAVGDRARVELPFQAGTVRTGRVRHLAPALADQTRALTVSIELSNPGGALRPGMYVDVVFDQPAARQVLTVPADAVIRSGTRDIVVLDRGGGTFQVREVVLGAEGTGTVEVREGLMDTDVVVVSAQFLIDSESTLREAIRKVGTVAAAEPDVASEPPSAPPPMAPMDHGDQAMPPMDGM